MPAGHDISEAVVLGALTAPAVPATTVALTNPFPVACLVTVRGGTVSAVAINGNTLALLGSTYVVPKAGTITLTYAVGPSWDWYGLI